MARRSPLMAFAMVIPLVTILVLVWRARLRAKSVPRHLAWRGDPYPAPMDSGETGEQCNPFPLSVELNPSPPPQGAALLRFVLPMRPSNLYQNGWTRGGAAYMHTPPPPI